MNRITENITGAQAADILYNNAQEAQARRWTAKPYAIDESATYVLDGVEYLFRSKTAANSVTPVLADLNGNGANWQIIGFVGARRFDTTTAANLAIPDIVVNGRNLRDGVRVDIGTAANYTPYWWKGGTADANLVKYIPDLDLTSKADKSYVDLQFNGGLVSFGAPDDINTYTTLSVANTNYSRAQLGENGSPYEGTLEQLDFYVARAGNVAVRIMEPTGVANEYVSKYTMLFESMPIGAAVKVAGVDFAKNMYVNKGSIPLTLTYPSSTVGAIGVKTKSTTIMRQTAESGRDVGTKYTLIPTAISTELGLRMTLRAAGKIDEVNSTIAALTQKLYGASPATYPFGTSADLSAGFEAPIVEKATQAFYGLKGFTADGYARSIEFYVATAGRVLLRLSKPASETNVNSFVAYLLISKTLPVGYAVLMEGIDYPKNTVVYKGGVLATYTEVNVYGAIGQRVSPAVNLYVGASRLNIVGTAATIYKNNSNVEIGLRVNIETPNPIADLSTKVSQLTALPEIKSNYLRRATANNRRNSGINIFKTKEGNVGAVYTETFGGDGNDYNESKIGVVHSLDGGKTWGAPMFKPKPGFAESNTSLVRLENGDLILFYSYTETQNGFRVLTISRSYDSGQTWTQGEDTGIRLTTGTGSMRASDGNLYMPIYGGTTGGKILISTDNGATFTDMGFSLKDALDVNIENSTSLTEPGLYEISQGNFIFFFRSLERGYTRAMQSLDYGKTWGAPFNLFKAPDSMSAVRKISYLNNNLTEASMYIAVHNRLTAATSQGNSEDRKYMVISVSRDGINFVTTDVQVYSFDGNAINSRSFEPNIYDDGVAIRIGWSTFRNTGTNPLESALMASLSYTDLKKIVDYYIPQ